MKYFLWYDGSGTYHTLLLLLYPGSVDALLTQIASSYSYDFYCK